MSIQFSCPKCDTVFSVPDKRAGMRCKCPKCQNVLRVPEPLYAEVPKPNPRRETPLSYWAYVSGALGLLCLPPMGLVGIVLGAIGLNREGNNGYAWRGIILGTGAVVLWGIGLLMLKYVEGLIQ